MSVSREGIFQELAPELGPIGEQMGYLLRRALLLVFREFIASTAEFQLAPTEYAVLEILDQAPELRQNRLSEILAIKPANCATLIDKLEKRGLVRRKKLPLSGRAIALVLTEAGSAFLEDMRSSVEIHRQRVTDRLGPSNSKQLIRLLKQLIVSG